MSPTLTLPHPAPNPVTRGLREPRQLARWLVLAYLAGDNDLAEALGADLAEMERVGSHPGSVEILAQLDRGPDQGAGDWTNARRYYVTCAPEPSRLLADLEATNTGILGA